MASVAYDTWTSTTNCWKSRSFIFERNIASNDCLSWLFSPVVVIQWDRCRLWTLNKVNKKLSFVCLSMLTRIVAYYSKLQEQTVSAFVSTLIVVVVYIACGSSCIWNSKFAVEDHEIHHCATVLLLLSSTIKSDRWIFWGSATDRKKPVTNSLMNEFTVIRSTSIISCKQTLWRFVRTKWGRYIKGWEKLWNK